MASWSFFEGKTVDAALKKAGKELGVPTEKLEYEIVFAGSSGIFGLVGAKNAQIRVVTPSPQSRSKESTVVDKDRQEILSLVDETFADTTSNREPIKAPVSRATGKGAVEAKKKYTEADTTSHREPTKAPVSRATGKGEAEAEKKYTEADFETGKKALSRIVDCIVAGATLSVQVKDQQVLFNIEGDNAAMLIGKHGQTLKAMQHIVEKVVHKSCGEQVRVLVDVENYMEKRRDSLRSLATRLADKVKQTGKPTTINRMDAFERKTIHDTLRKDKKVTTRSTGGGEIRNVVIHPGKKSGRTKKAADK